MSTPITESYVDSKNRTSARSLNGHRFGRPEDSPESISQILRLLNGEISMAQLAEWLALHHPRAALRLDFANMASERIRGYLEDARITPRAASAGRLMTEQVPAIFPADDGGLRVEWHGRGFDVEALINSGSRKDAAGTDCVFMGEA